MGLREDNGRAAAEGDVLSCRGSDAADLAEIRSCRVLAPLALMPMLWLPQIDAAILGSNHINLEHYGLDAMPLRRDRHGQLRLWGRVSDISPSLSLASIATVVLCLALGAVGGASLGALLEKQYEAHAPSARIVAAALIAASTRPRDATACPGRARRNRGVPIPR